jgi:hypothetical protein
MRTRPRIFTPTAAITTVGEGLSCTSYVHPQIADPQFPRRNEARLVRLHGLAVARLDGGLVTQLPLDRIEDGGPLARGETGQVVVGVIVEADRVGHGP